MDIARISTEQTHHDDAVECVLYDNGVAETSSTGETVAVFVLGEHSKPARQIAQQQKTQLAKLVRRYGSWDAIPQTELDALNDVRVASCLTAWRGFESNGEAIPFTVENARTVIAALRAHRPTHLKQIEGAIEGHDSFFRKGSEVS